MSAIIGVWHLDAKPLDAEIPAQMLATLIHRGPDGRNVWCQNTIGLGHAMLWTTPESLIERQPLCSRDGVQVLVCDARIDNRQELINTLRLYDRPAAQITDAELILAAYQKWGEECPMQLIGDFAFTIWNEARRELFCARDPMGVKSLYYHHQNRLFAFASEIKALFQVPEVPRVLNEERVAEHLAFVFDDQASTFYREIYRLPAGYCAIISTRGMRLRRYWTWDPTYELTLRSDGEYEEAFRELLSEAVHCRLRSAFPVGTALSGGLDSSSITCIARNYLKENEPHKRLHTFSAIFPGLPEPELRRIDERAYIQAVLADGDVVPHEIRADRLNPLGDLEQILWHQDDPLVPFNIYMHRGIYHAARAQGVRVILDGFDGDTTVSHGYERLAELAIQLHWRTLLKEVHSMTAQSKNQMRALYRLLQHFTFNPLVIDSFVFWWKKILGPSAISIDKNSVVSKDFISKINIKKRMYGAQYKNCQYPTSARKFHLQGFESPLIPYSLEMADKSAITYSLEPRYPFFDRRLMEFCLALPADQKFRSGWNRSILRRSMQGILPREIQWRAGKANLSPNFYLNLLGFNKEIITKTIKENELFVNDFIDFHALKTCFAKYMSQPSNVYAMALFTPLTFIVWFKNNIFDPE
ncbi:MAG: lasso peptide isopeptide bond-forming cyclase [Gammaproteobacteria bacterium]